jgi:Rrf2 family protein
MTHEADYAVRVVALLANHGTRLGAKEISECTGVTLRFSLKILRKLIANGILRSYKGATGGYELNQPPEQISLGAIIECIDGPILINACLHQDYDCTGVHATSDCDFHKIFGSINTMIRQELYSVTMDRFIHNNVKLNSGG